ncbi:putative HMG1 protein [Mycena crocata]|nr:putative HMG1 protein [Mycena crocata]
MELSRFRFSFKQTTRLPMIRSAGTRCRFSLAAALPPYKQPVFRLPPLRSMPVTLARRHLSSDAMPSLSDDMAMKESMAFLNFDEPQFEEQFLQSPEEQMLFDFDDYSPYPQTTYPTSPEYTSEYDSSGSDFVHEPFKTEYTSEFIHHPTSGELVELRRGPKQYFPPASHPVPEYELASPPYSPSSPYGSHQEDFKSPPNLFISSYMPSPSSPIPIPSASPQSPSFISFGEHSAFKQDAPFSPGFAAALPLPSSNSPSSSSFEDRHYAVPRQVESVSPHETQTPAWAGQLWEAHRHLRTPSSPRSSARHSPLSGDQRLRNPARRNSLSSGQLFPSSSAPSVAPVGQNTIRSYSRRAESFSTPDDRDATVRRKKRNPEPEESEVQYKAHDSPPLKSMLRPPKLAPSAWQLYFTDWIQRQQASSSRKLNVAQAAKEAGQEYASLSEEEKEPYKRRSQAAKDIRERELNAYMRTLTPDDIKRENAFRSAQRKAGKSRKSNIKDPNAPKKPLSAYFMFLQRIRANPELVREIFGDETETTKQSVLAAAKWRSMTDDERKPFLAQAEQEKMEYEAARRMYEDGSVGYGSSINFSILPGSPAFPAIKIESESESEGFATDDSLYHIRS